MKRLCRVCKKYKEIICYLIAGVLTTIVSLGVYYICVMTFLNPDIAVQLQAANIISWIASVSFAYVVNSRYVFDSTNTNKIKEIAAFLGSRVTTLLMDMACMFLLVTVAQINDKFGKLIVQVIVMTVNYLLSKFMVFRKK